MKQLKDYLPFYLGCECVFEDCRNAGDKEQGKLIEIGINMACIETANNDDPYIECTPNEIKPILRPLSDMTKEIEHNGNKFIPLKVLAGMAGTCSPGDWIIKSEYEVEHKTAKGCTFRISSSFDFIMKRSEKWKDFEVCAQQVLMFKKSIEWGFDLFGLIESGLAIDKNTLK